MSSNDENARVTKKASNGKAASNRSLGTDNEERSVRHRHSLKPPPRSDVKVDSNHRSEGRNIEVPDLDGNLVGAAVATKPPQPESARQLKSSNGSSSRSLALDGSIQERRAARRAKRHEMREKEEQAEPKTSATPRIPEGGGASEHREKSSSSPRRSRRDLNRSASSSRNNDSQYPRMPRKDESFVSPASSMQRVAIDAVSTADVLANAITTQDVVTPVATSSSTRALMERTNTASCLVDNPSAFRDVSTIKLRDEARLDTDAPATITPRPPSAPGAFHMAPSGSSSVQRASEYDNILEEGREVGQNDRILDAVVSPMAASSARHENVGSDLYSNESCAEMGLEDHLTPSSRSNGEVARIPVAAQLVPNDDELERLVEEKMKQRLQKEVETRLENERRKHLVVEAVQIDESNRGSVGNLTHHGDAASESSPKRRNWRMIWIGAGLVGLVVLVAAIAGGVTASNNKKSEPAPTQAPTVVTTERYQEMVESIGALVASETSVFFTSTETPQYLAMDWLANDDLWVDAEERETADLVERYSMAVLYYSTDGPNWRSQYSFLDADSICRWNDGTSDYVSNVTSAEGFGVYCGRDERVQEIWLGDNKASGSLPTELGLFSSLTYLAFSFNELVGSIPKELFRPQNLSYLEFYDTKGLTGTIPTEVGQAVNLDAFDLAQNRLNGSLPEGLYGLSKLTFLDVAENIFSGTIATGIGSLKSLLTFVVDSNRFRGTIPEELYDLTDLQQLTLSSNIFSGSISSKIGALTNLTESLDLRANKFTGTLPSELGLLAFITELYLEINDFSGTIPSEIANILNLQTFSVGDNRGLGGSIPSSFLLAENLQNIRLDGTQVTGVEEVFCALPSGSLVEMWADCLGDEPEVVCTCCNVCCNNLGNECEEMTIG